MPAMKLWSAFWAYWKWFCTTLVTSTVLLLLIAVIAKGLTSIDERQKDAIATCIERGGAWDDAAGVCKHTG